MLHFASYKDPTPELIEGMHLPYVPILILMSNKGYDKDVDARTNSDLNMMPMEIDLSYEPLMNWFLKVNYLVVCVNLFFRK